MSKKGKDFKAGDFIFAKVKGYPAWPARIRGKNGKKFFVYFYGTGETANLMANVLYDYKDNKDKFLAKAIKRRDFNDGLLQINYEIENNIPLPAEEEEAVAHAESAGDADKDSSTVADSTMEVDADTTLNETAESGGDDNKISDNALNESAANNSAVNDSAVNDSAVNDTAQNDSTLDEAVDPDDSDEANPPLVIDEDKKTRKTKAPAPLRAEFKRKPVTLTPSKDDEQTPATPTTGRGRPRSKRAAEESPTIVATPAKKRRHIETVAPAGEPETQEDQAEESSKDAKIGDKVVEESHSENTEEMETETPLKVAESPDVTAEVVTPKVSKGGRPKTQYNNVSLDDLSDLKEPFKEVLADDGKPKQNLLLVRLPNQRYVGIKLFQDRPKTFKTPAAKLSWESQMAQNAIDLKHKLEAGLIKPSHIPNEIVTELNLSDEDKKNIEKEKEIEENRYRLNFLRAEMKLGELTAKIKCNLGVQKADTKACLALMDELLTLEIKPLMLYKNHKIVETIKRLRSYVGDTHNWTMTEDELEQFTKDASRIRKKAEECYQCFKLLFPEPAEGVTFFQQFSQKHGLFHACTKSLTEDQMLELVHEPAEMLDSSDSIQPILDAMNEDDEEEVPKKRRKTTNTPAKLIPAADTKGKRGRPGRRTTQTDTETIDKPNDVRPNVDEKEKEVSEKDKDKLEDAKVIGESSAMEVDQSSEITDAEKEKSEAAEETPNIGIQSTDKSDKGSLNKSEKSDKVSSKGGSSDAAKDKDKDKHSRSSDKVSEKSVKSRSDDSSKHSSSSKHSKISSEKDKSTSKSSERSDKSGLKSDKAKSERKSIQDKDDSSGLKKKAEDDEKAGTSSSTKDSDKAEDRDSKREKSSSGVNGTENEGDTDKSSSFSKADKVRKSSSSSSHQSDSSKYTSKKKSVK